MAGGMGRRDDDAFPRETLAERVANTRSRQAGREAPSDAPIAAHSTAGFNSRHTASPPKSWAAPPALPPSPTSPAPLIRHCFYLSPDHGRLPALFLKWRQTSHRGMPPHFDGFICTIALDESGTWCLTELWVDSAMLEPA